MSYQHLVLGKRTLVISQEFGEWQSLVQVRCWMAEQLGLGIAALLDLLTILLVLPVSLCNNLYELCLWLQAA